jgi:hypothetical protein
MALRGIEWANIAEPFCFAQESLVEGRTDLLLQDSD